MTSLDHYKRDTHHEKPNTVQEYQHFAGWCKRNGRIEDQIWAQKEMLSRTPKGSEEALDVKVALSESYLTFLNILRLSVRSNMYSPNRQDFWTKGQRTCKEARKVSESIPSNEIRHYGTGEEIGYLCDKFENPKTVTDFRSF